MHPSRLFISHYGTRHKSKHASACHLAADHRICYSKSCDMSLAVTYRIVPAEASSVLDASKRSVRP